MLALDIVTQALRLRILGNYSNTLSYLLFHCYYTKTRQYIHLGGMEVAECIQMAVLRMTPEQYS